MHDYCYFQKKLPVVNQENTVKVIARSFLGKQGALKASKLIKLFKHKDY